MFIKKKSKILIISHVGRPNGKVNKDLSLKPICESLEKKINQKVTLIKDDILELNNMMPSMTRQTSGDNSVPKPSTKSAPKTKVSKRTKK